MGFRERPEYQSWRDAVFRLFGQKCIRCGHAGNIHAHHIMPVEDYPELAFEPTNGVPLCGNCHTEIKGDELAHVDDLKRRQRAILGGETPVSTKEIPSEPALRERAFAEPINAEAVNAWFTTTADSHAVVGLWEGYRSQFTALAPARINVLRHLMALGRWQDVVTEADALLGTLLKLSADAAAQGNEEASRACETTARLVAPVKAMSLSQLGRHAEAAAFLREMVVRFPESAELHQRLSIALYQMILEKRDDNTIEECLRHTLRTIELAPEQFQDVLRAGRLLVEKADRAGPEGSSNDPAYIAAASAQKRIYASALQYGGRALALAATNQEKILALLLIAEVNVNNELYADARTYLSQALRINDGDVRVISQLAGCYAAEAWEEYFPKGNDRVGIRLYDEAVRLAKRGLLLDPDNYACQEYAKMSISTVGWQIWNWPR